MTITLESLPYEQNALEPFISQETLMYHYTKHHQGYVTKLNGLVPTSSIQSTNVADYLTKQIYEKERGVFNNAAQIWNHTFYWKSMKPTTTTESVIPKELKEELVKSFGSVEEFKTKFKNVALNHFGSGWVWLIKSQNKLEIVDTHDAYSPIVDNQTPLIVLDVWEHAYYIDKRNNRGGYIDDWFKIVNWEFAHQNFVQAKL
jgi:superoxide dismutase, Fe-Mn family